MSPPSRNSLDRYLQAQENTYNLAISELRSGQKKTHWMWFIFPQLRGLGFSSKANFFGIQDLKEARDYLAHPVLGDRLRECTQAALEIVDGSALQVFGYPDELKLKSCATLFAQASPSPNIFDELLEKFFDGESDSMTIEILHLDQGGHPRP